MWFLISVDSFLNSSLRSTRSVTLEVRMGQKRRTLRMNMSLHSLFLSGAWWDRCMGKKNSRCGHSVEEMQLWLMLCRYGGSERIEGISWNTDAVPFKMLLVPVPFKLNAVTIVHFVAMEVLYLGRKLPPQANEAFISTNWSVVTVCTMVSSRRGSKRRRSAWMPLHFAPHKHVTMLDARCTYEIPHIYLWNLKYIDKQDEDTMYYMVYLLCKQEACSHEACSPNKILIFWWKTFVLTLT